MTEDPDVRVVSGYDGDTRLIVSVFRSPETDAMTDDELLNRFRQTIRERRHLRAVDDE